MAKRRDKVGRVDWQVDYVGQLQAYLRRVDQLASAQEHGKMTPEIEAAIVFQLEECRDKLNSLLSKLGR